MAAETINGLHGADGAEPRCRDREMAPAPFFNDAIINYDLAAVPVT